MPDAVAAVRATSPAPTTSTSSTTPSPADPPPRHHARSRERRRLRGQRARSRRCGAVEPGSLPAALAGSRRRAWSSAHAARRDVLDSLVSRMATPTSAAATLRRPVGRAPTRAGRAQELCERYGNRPGGGCDDELHDYSERRVRTAIAASRTGGSRPPTRSSRSTAESSRFTPSSPRRHGLEIDFAGTAAQHEGNLNCPLAVARSRLPTSSCAASPTRTSQPPRRFRSGARPRAEVASSTPGRRPVAAGNVETPAGSWTSSSPRSPGRRRAQRKARGR